MEAHCREERNKKARENYQARKEALQVPVEFQCDEEMSGYEIREMNIKAIKDGLKAAGLTSIVIITDNHTEMKVFILPYSIYFEQMHRFWLKAEHTHKIRRKTTDSLTYVKAEHTHRIRRKGYRLTNRLEEG